MGLSWREDLTRADVAFDATGSTPVEVLRVAWNGLLEVMLPGGWGGAGAVRQHTFVGSAWSVVLLGLLEWVVYVKDAEGVLLAPAEMVCVPADTDVTVRVTATSVPVDTVRDRLGTDVKAVTMHHFDMVQTSTEGWRATVVLDV